MNTQKICCRCRTQQSTSNYYRLSSAKDGLCPRCKKCESERQGHKKKAEISRKPLTACELAYLAAYIDGEGFIGLVKPKEGSRGATGHLLYARMSITSTHPDFVSICESYDLGKVYFVPSKKRNHKDRHDWYIRSNEMKWLLPQLVPYLRLKRTQAELMLNYFSQRRNRSDEYKQAVLDIYHQIRLLNRRGRVCPSISTDSAVG